MNIQIITNDDDTNRQSGLKYEDYFETYRLAPHGYYGYNIMHDKFCVIDFKTVIHGSYNWSKSANWNNETISVSENREIAEKFADEFIKLKIS